MKTLVGLLTGHCSLIDHMEMIGVVISSIYNQCEQEEETDLQFIYSQAFSDFRRRHLGNVSFKDLPCLVLPLEYVLKFAKAYERRRLEAIE